MISVTMLFIVCVVYRRITISILYEDIESTASIISTYNQFNNSENVQNTRHSGHTSGKEPAYRQCRRLKRRGFDPWVGKIPLRRKWQPTPVFLPGESHDRGAWRATVHEVAKSWTRLSEVALIFYFFNFYFIFFEVALRHYRSTVVFSQAVVIHSCLFGTEESGLHQRRPVTESIPRNLRNLMLWFRNNLNSLRSTQENKIKRTILLEQ